MIFLRNLALICMLLTIAPSHADGMPLPWPFPWAKECPVVWEDMQGEYTTSDEPKTAHPDLQIAILIQNGSRLIRVTRLSSTGQMIYDGWTTIDDSDRSVSLTLLSLVPSHQQVRATLQLHYMTQQSDCGTGSLVPILTIQKVNLRKSQTLNYRLIRINPLR